MQSGGWEEMTRQIQRWEEGEFSAPRPLCFCGCPPVDVRPSTFPYLTFELQHPSQHYTAFLYYLNGWTALAFWNADIYFADEILTFDGMIELLRERFASHFYFKSYIVREFEEHNV